MSPLFLIMEITTTHKGHTFKVLLSPEDADIAQRGVYSRVRKSSYPELSTYSPELKKTSSLSRTIMKRILQRDLTSQECVDHINRNPLDNRRDNLRLCSRSENNKNIRKKRQTKNNFKGLSLNKIGTWRVEITSQRTRYYLGTFDTEAEARAAYIGAAKVLHGDFACFD